MNCNCTLNFPVNVKIFRLIIACIVQMFIYIYKFLLMLNLFTFYTRKFSFPNIISFIFFFFLKLNNFLLWYYFSFFFHELAQEGNKVLIGATYAICDYQAVT